MSLDISSTPCHGCFRDVLHSCRYINVDILNCIDAASMTRQPALELARSCILRCWVIYTIHSFIQSFITRFPIHGSGYTLTRIMYKPTAVQE